MRIRNSNRVPSSQGVIQSQELEEIEVLSFSVVDEDKLKEISQQLHNDLHISGFQANYFNQPQIPEENSSTNQHYFAQANPNQAMANEDGGGEADSGVKSISMANIDQEEETLSNATINLAQVTSSSGKAITVSTVDKNEETSSSKRIRSICQSLEQSKEVGDFGYDLRPRHRGKVIKTQSLESVNKGKNQKPTSSNVVNEEEDILIIDMLNEEMKKKLRGSLEKKL